jgi:hypothetical protein
MAFIEKKIYTINIHNKSGVNEKFKSSKMLGFHWLLGLVVQWGEGDVRALVGS